MQMIPGNLRRAQLLVVFVCAISAFAKNAIHVVVVPVANMYSKPSEKADVVSQTMYGDNVVLKQEPLQVDFAEDVWTIRGSPIGEPTGESLIALISKKDGRILKVGTVVVFRRDA